MPVDDVAARGFGAGAAAYEAARPGYPDEAIALLADEVGIGAGTEVCDLAAGTGKLTRRLLELGARVTAVEPIDAMRAQAEVAAPGATHLDGTAEAIPLDGRVGRRRHRRPGLPLVRRPGGARRDRPGAPARTVGSPSSGTSATSPPRGWRR